MISQTTTEGRYTHVAVWAEDGTVLDGLHVVGEGDSRCRPDDLYSRQVGELIALGRAIQDYGRQVEGIGQSRTATKEEAQRVLGILGEFAALVAEE